MPANHGDDPGDSLWYPGDSLVPDSLWWIVFGGYPVDSLWYPGDSLWWKLSRIYPADLSGGSIRRIVFWPDDPADSPSGTTQWAGIIRQIVRRVTLRCGTRTVTKHSEQCRFL